MLQYENFVVYKSFNNIIKIDENNCSTKLLENKNLKKILKFNNKLLILTTKLLYIYDFKSTKPIYAVKDLKIKHFFCIQDHIYIITNDKLITIDPQHKSHSLDKKIEISFNFYIKKRNFIHIKPRFYFYLFEKWYIQLFHSINENINDNLEEISVILYTFNNWFKKVFSNLKTKLIIQNDTIIKLFDYIHIDQEKDNIFIFFQSKKNNIYICDFIYYICNHIFSPEMFVFHKIDIIRNNNITYLVKSYLTQESLYLDYSILNIENRSIMNVFVHDFYIKCLSINDIFFLQHNDYQYIFIKNKLMNLSFDCKIFNFTKKILKKLTYQNTTLENRASIIENYQKILYKCNSFPQENTTKQFLIGKCSICMENVSNILFLPCSHFCCCNICSENLFSCPICREEIYMKKNIFFS